MNWWCGTQTAGLEHGGYSPAKIWYQRRTIMVLLGHAANAWFMQARYGVTGTQTDALFFRELQLLPLDTQRI